MASSWRDAGASKINEALEISIPWAITTKSLVYCTSFHSIAIAANTTANTTANTKSYELSPRALATEKSDVQTWGVQ